MTPVERGKKHRSTRNRDEGRGSTQGSPISPLLSNLYMRRFVLGWKKMGHEQRLGAYIVNYADDLVVCCRGRAEEALPTTRVMMTKLKQKKKPLPAKLVGVYQLENRSLNLSRNSNEVSNRRQTGNVQGLEHFS